jgi:hypothetical protein
MPENSPSPEEWRRLFEASVAIKLLALWEWMSEDMVFSLQSPETDQPSYRPTTSMDHM